MKLRKFLTLFVLSMGAFFVLSDQNAKAQGGTFCQSTGNWCLDDCWVAYNNWSGPGEPDPVWLLRCNASCDANRYACYSANAWQNWLLQVNLNIGDNFLILDEPSPYCGNYPDMLVSCGNLPTAEEIDACVLMVQQEQAKFHCP